MLGSALQKYWHVCIDILSYEHISNMRHHFELSHNYLSINHLHLERSMRHDEQLQCKVASLLYFKYNDFMSIITLMTPANESW